MSHKDKDRVHAVQALSRDILSSPYVFKELPEELHRLQNLMRSVEVLLREEVPCLITEIKELRAVNKRLLAASAVEAPVLVDTHLP
jgi:hypothetical protein